jgi:hypothetical protein
MAHRVINGEPESEPVLVDTDNPRSVVLELDDGGVLVLDAVELRAAIIPTRIAA